MSAARRASRAVRPALVPTEGQQAAFNLIERAIDERLPFAVIAGYAGTGKTTLLKRALHLHPLLLAPTGKAALRLRAVTGRKALTIHRACYEAVEDGQGQLTFQKRGLDPHLPRHCQAIFVDEASMVSERAFDDLVAEGRRLGIPVIFLGDPAQLPPADQEGDEAFSVMTLSTSYRVELREVLRQAAESPIISASMRLRRGEWQKALAAFPRVGRATAVEEAYRVYAGGGAVICHTNRTRAELNAAMRALQGYPGGALQVGEPLLVMRNDYRINACNGELVTFAGWEQPPSPWRSEALGRTVRLGLAQLQIPQGADEPARDGRAWLCQEVVDGQVGGLELRRLAREHAAAQDPRLLPQTYLQAEYGYALTAHKAQGSEWPEVMVVIEPSLRLSDREAWRWTYTAITRARERVRVFFGRPTHPVRPGATPTAEAEPHPHP